MDEAFRQVGGAVPAIASATTAPLAVSGEPSSINSTGTGEYFPVPAQSQQYQPPVVPYQGGGPYGYAQYPFQPPPSAERDWKDWFVSGSRPGNIGCVESIHLHYFSRT